MGVGVLLAVVGAILTFAVRANTSVISLPIVGVILMIAGAALIWHGSKGTRRKRIITREERPERRDDPDQHRATDDRGTRHRLSRGRSGGRSGVGEDVGPRRGSRPSSRRRAAASPTRPPRS